MGRSVTCSDCIQTRARARAAGLRGNGVCFDCAAVELPDSYFAEVTEEHRRQARREMGLSACMTAEPEQPDLFGAAA